MKRMPKQSSLNWMVLERANRTDLLMKLFRPSIHTVWFCQWYGRMQKIGNEQEQARKSVQMHANQGHCHCHYRHRSHQLHRLFWGCVCVCVHQSKSTTRFCVLLCFWSGWFLHSIALFISACLCSISFRTFRRLLCCNFSFGCIWFFHVCTTKTIITCWFV